MPQLGETISIDYDAVGSMADNFHNSSDVMLDIDKALEIAITILKTSALFGQPGNAALAAYLSGIRPNLQRLAGTCEEMSGDLKASITAFQEGDTSGSARFNK